MSIVTIIVAFAAEYGLYIAGAAALAGVVAWWTIKQRRAGRKAAEAKQQEKVNVAVRERAKADSVVGGATDDELDSMLRRPDRR